MHEHARSARGTAAAGAVVVNAALITPLLLLIVLGIVETALLMRDNVALASLLHQGSHAAASSLGPESPLQPAEVAAATAVSVANAKAALSKAAIGELWVYRADAAGFPVGSPDNDHFDRCTTDCIAYMWDASERAFHYTGGHWDDDHIDGCSEVGVYVKASHSFLTGVFAHAVDISKHETFRLASGADCQVVTS